MNNNAYEYPFRDPSLPLEERVSDLLSRLTREEKFNFIPTRQAAIERLGIPYFEIGGEGAHGYIDRVDSATAFPQTIGLACTWDRALFAKIGKITGVEARACHNRDGRKGGICLWFPTVDLERSPYWGRTEEGYGEDPYLTGELAVPLIRAAQNEESGYLMVTSGPKHFFANNNETHRGSCNCSIPARCLEEYYLKPFEAAMVKGACRSIMTSYNEVNGIPMILNPMLRTIVKEKWGLEKLGHIVTDGGDYEQTVTLHHYFTSNAQTIAKCFENGGDVMNDAPEIVVPALEECFANGTVTDEMLDEHVAGVLRVRFQLGQFDPAEMVPYNSIGTDAIMCDEHIATARQSVAESVVLLKDEGDALPVCANAEKKLAVVGFSAQQIYADWYTALLNDRAVNILKGLKARFGEENVDYLETRPVVSFTTVSGLPLVISEHYSALVVGKAGEAPARFYRENWGFGSNTLRSVDTELMLDIGFISKPNHIPTEEELAERAMIAENYPIRCDAPHSLNWYVSTQFGITVQEDSSLEEGCQRVVLRAYNGSVLKAGGEGESVRCARPFSLNNEDMFIMRTEETLPCALEKIGEYGTVLCMTASNPMIHARECIDRPSLRLPETEEALMLAVAERAKQQGTRAIGLLITSYPYVCPEVIDAYDTLLTVAHGMQEFGNGLADVLSGDVPFSGHLPMEWVGTDYPGAESVMEYDIIKHRMTYMYSEREPLFPFGHGLTLKPVEYSEPRLKSDGYKLYLSFTLENTADFAQVEVAQAYIAFDQNTGYTLPLRKLAAFERIELAAHEKREVTLLINHDSFHRFDNVLGKFVAAQGNHSLCIGASSRDIRLRLNIATDSDLEEAVYGANSALRPFCCDDYENMTLIERRGSAEPAAYLDTKKGDAFLRFDRMVCEGGSYTFTAEVFADDVDAAIELYRDEEAAPFAVLDIPYTADFADWPKGVGERNFPLWAHIERRVEMPQFADNIDHAKGEKRGQSLKIVARGRVGIHVISLAKAD